MHPGWHHSQKHAPGGCGIADGTNRPWSVGDNENLAVGQGDVQVTPLQLAVAYSALENGGSIVTPHLGLNVQNTDGTVLQQIDPAPARHITIDPFYRQTILDGLRAAASQPGGTSVDVMGNFPQQVYGKTGTAQYTGQTRLRLVRLLRAQLGHQQADPGRRPRRARRLRRRGGRAGRAPDPFAVVLRQARRLQVGQLANAMSAG